MLRFVNAAVLVLAVALPAAGAESFSGRIRVIDGDTLDVSAVRVRLHGIDAPELDQTCETDDGRPWPCGAWARDEVQRRYAGARATCRAVETDRYGRVVAKCDADGADIGERLVRDGIAQAFRRYSLDYVDAEKAAIFAEAGIWRGRVEAPADFRAERAAVSPPPEGACRIKGNISGSGRIYHLPGQEHYAITRISPEKGERWFCTEAEARAAGWRRARR